MEHDPVLTDPRYLELVEENKALKAELAALKLAFAEIQKLLSTAQEKLSKDSHNSSKSPGSDGPQAKPRPTPKSTGRKRGGQIGHDGKARDRLPEGSEKTVVPVKLDKCPHCHHEIPPEAISGTKMHRVLDLVKELTEVIGYQLEEGVCPHCQKHVKAEMPPGAGVGEMGHRLRCLVAYMRTQGHMSIGNLQFYFSEILGIDVSRGWIYNSGLFVSDVVKEAWELLKEEIQRADVLNLDETGFGHKERNWIWVALSARTVFFHFSHTRGFDALKVILPEDFSGVLGTDRFSTYKKLKDAVRQFCWAHLKREFVALSESKDEAVARLGKQLLDDQGRVFDKWHQFREGKITRSELRKTTSTMLARIKQNLRLASQTEHKAAKALGKDLIKNWNKLWVFLRVDNVEPTNNAAERALRPLVILKRIFQRLPSEGGKQFFERLFSIGATARIRGVPIFEWLMNAVKAACQKRPLPALEPG